MLRDYDKKVPPLLKRSQQWFASIITQPIDENSHINPITPLGNSIIVEANEFIAPSPTLKPHQRIELYNQQYWWRLLGIIQDAFALLLRLFGYEDFNQRIAIPFLLKYPPDSWSLNHLGSKLPQWIEEEYNEEDKELILNCAKLDWSFQHSFLCKELPPLVLSDSQGKDMLKGIENETIYLQPHIHLLLMEYNLPLFREAFLKEEVPYWVENDFPELIRKKDNEDKYFHFAIFRTLKNDIFWKELHPAAFQLLSFFQKGSTIDSICDWIEKQEKPLNDEITKNLAEWFQEWTMRRWLTTADFE